MNNPNVEPKYVEPFKKICMTIGELPSSYLETMSYYEMLVWFVEFLKNKVIPAVNKNAEAVQELQQLYVELKDYVDNYFDNLDIQEEINNKLDEMAESGELTALIKAYVDPIYESYEQRIDEQVSNQEIRIRQVENQVKGIASIPPTPVSSINDMTDTNKYYLLLTDGYIYYYDGTSWIQGWIYQSSQIADNSVNSKMLKNNILKNQDMKYLPLKYNINTIKNINCYNLALYAAGNVGPGNTNGNRLTSFNYLQFSKNPLFKPINDTIEYFVNVYSQKARQTGSFDFTSLNLESGTINNSGVPATGTYQVRTTDFIVVESDTLFEPDFNNYVTFIFKYNLDDSFIERVNIGASNPTYTFETTYKYKIVFQCNITGYPITDNVAFFISSIKNSFLTELVEQITSGWYDYAITHNNSNNYLYKLSMRKKNNSPFAVDDTIDNYILVSDDLLTPLQNKKISVLGDSFSAYDGIIPSSNVAYYTGSNAGVNNYNQMWWQRLINNNGATREVIQASSGSNVSFIRNQTLALSNTNMCEDLGNPDIIIILGGTNDYSHTPALLGEFNGTQDFPSTNLNFSDAYALMLSRILTTYPNATIFCCSIPTFVRTNLNKAQCERNTETNAEHKTIFDYSEKIREIAEIMNCQYIDLSECGFNRENYYPSYCQDSSINSTHPNAKGQEVIFKTIEKKVLSVLNNLK